MLVTPVGLRKDNIQRIANFNTQISRPYQNNDNDGNTVNFKMSNSGLLQIKNVLSPISAEETILKIEEAVKGHLKPLFTEEMVQNRISELAKQINQDYGNKDVYIICVLNGAKRFADDLSKKMGRKVNGTVKLESYGESMTSSGAVKEAYSNLSDIKEGTDILVIEDIVDTGNSMDYLLKVLRDKYKPKTLKLATLLDKPAGRVKDVPVDYCGFTIDDKFAVGYGLDYNQMGRELDTIYQVEF